MTPTIHGNLMIGPSAEYFTPEQEREDYSTTQSVMDQLGEEGMDLLPMRNMPDCIRSFAGIRPKLVSEQVGGYADFVIEESSRIPGYIQLLGIESPGLTSSIPIGKMVAQIVEEIMVRKHESGVFTKEPMEQTRCRESSPVKIPETPKGDPGDKKMLCRCEGITEDAVLTAFDHIIEIGGIPTVKGLKNRTRVTMGSCQGSFCTLNIIELLQKKRSVNPLQLGWNGFGSQMFDGRVKE